MRQLSILLTLLLAGCAAQSNTSVSIPSNLPIERVAYNTIVSAKAFLDQMKSGHPECATTNAATTLCADLAKATAAKDLLIDAAEVYCSSPQFESGGACQPNPANNSLVKLQAAITYYNQTATDVKGVVK